MEWMTGSKWSKHYSNEFDGVKTGEMVLHRPRKRNKEIFVRIVTEPQDVDERMYVYIELIHECMYAMTHSLGKRFFLTKRNEKPW